MPIYVYACGNCEATFEDCAPMAEAGNPRPCPGCKKPAPREYTPVHVKCDGNFMRGRKDLGGAEFEKDPLVKNEFIDRVKKKGVSIQGRTYQAGLARYPGDPEAYISSLDDARRILKQRGWGCPELGIKGKQVDPGEPIPVADDCVRNELERMVECKEMSLKKANSEAGWLEVANRLTPIHKKKLIKSPKERKALKKAKK